jgi:hypothetical protein
LAASGCCRCSGRGTATLSHVVKTEGAFQRDTRDDKTATESEYWNRQFISSSQVICERSPDAEHCRYFFDG